MDMKVRYIAFFALMTATFLQVSAAEPVYGPDGIVAGGSAGGVAVFREDAGSAVVPGGTEAPGFVAPELNSIPSAWKWISDDEVIFSYDGSYTDSTAFVIDASAGKRYSGVTAPEKYSSFPVQPEGAVNLTYSPDSTMLAFTRDNDLYVVEIASGREHRLTYDGTELILNGYASWVYYEEILGRPSHYKAFWWSPDSRKIGFYRFDNTGVPLFPIYSPFGQDGSLRRTRYPKAGETNPQVRIGIVDISSIVRPSSSYNRDDGALSRDSTVRSEVSAVHPDIVWADFSSSEDCYFGIPFWGADSREFFISRMPRIQNTLDLYAVSVSDGSRKHVYHETYGTWIDWINEVIFTDKGLYMSRAFETGWQQLYFLSYDGSGFRRLTDGPNWAVRLVRVDETKGDVYFTAQRDSRIKSALYKVDRKGTVSTLTDTAYNVSGVSFSPDGKYFAASVSNVSTPTKIIVARSTGKAASDLSVLVQQTGTVSEKRKPARMAGSRDCIIAADMATETFDASMYAMPEIVWMTTSDGFRLPASVTLPLDFDPSRKYPVHVDIYGGPDTPMVRDRWVTPDRNNQWWSEHGIIQIVADCRAAGNSGRAGTDMVYRDLTTWPVNDFIAWAAWLKSLPYVDGDRIGVEGFSFGGTMTAMLLFRASDSYHYGIAGGGVYDWALYDSHYTERFMETPSANPDGYAAARVLNYVSSYPVSIGTCSLRRDSCPVFSSPDGGLTSPLPVTGGTASPDDSRNQSAVSPVMLKITHGTGDDNVHFQNTLQLVDELQRHGKKFELMVYPDGMHGYRGYQGKHFLEENRAFWLEYLKGEGR